MSVLPPKADTAICASKCLPHTQRPLFQCFAQCHAFDQLIGPKKERPATGGCHYGPRYGRKRIEPKRLSGVPYSVVVLKPCTTPFYGVAHVMEYKDREGRHALPLFWTKSFVQWLPRLGEFVQIG